MQKRSICVCLLFIALCLTVNTYGQVSDSLDVAPPGLLKQQLLEDFSDSDKLRLKLYNTKLPLFCAWEKQLEQSVQLPVKIRLGETQAVERKEGKLQNGWQKEPAKPAASGR